MRIESDLMRGAGPAAVLQLLAARDMYGYQLADALDRRSHGVLAMGHSTLYPLLYNLEAKGLIKARWEEAESGRRRKYYRLTGKGKRRLARQREQWQALVEALSRLDFLGEQPEGA